MKVSVLVLHLRGPQIHQEDYAQSLLEVAPLVIVGLLVEKFDLLLLAHAHGNGHIY